MIPFAPPAIQGLGKFGGFSFELQQTGGRQPGRHADDVARRNSWARQTPRTELTGLFSSFTASDPQFVVNIDREKAKSLSVPFPQITSALQIYMGSQYVNDFDFNNRSYRVIRAGRSAVPLPSRAICGKFYVRSDDGGMIPLDNLVTVKETTNASIINHYNLFRSAEINGSAAPGYSSGQAIAAMESSPKTLCHRATPSSGRACLSKKCSPAVRPSLLFGLGLLVVYLTLSAQYESFVLPFIILLPCPWRCLGALGAQCAARARKTTSTARSVS